MKLKIIIPVSIALIVLTVQCNKDENKVFSPGNISGTVTSKDDGSPIVGAEVTTNPISGLGIIQTGNTGYYSLDLVGGIYTLIITKENYSHFSKQITIDGNQLVENIQMEEMPLTEYSPKILLLE